METSPIRGTHSVAANKLSRVTNSGSVRVISQRAMRTASARLATFNGWTNDAVTPVLLSSAGFFYRGVDDQTQCISCFLVISQWGAEHDPWSEHRRHGPTCEFINANFNHRNFLFYLSFAIYFNTTFELLERSPFNTRKIFCLHCVSQMCQLIYVENWWKTWLDGSWTLLQIGIFN